MPLDIMPARTVTATLHYLKRGAEKPARYVSEPPGRRAPMEWHRRSA